MLAAARILGSGGFVPTGRRETSSLLLLPEDGDGAVVVDAGTGIRRLVTDRALLDGRRTLDVLLTHFHLDHVCGLAYLTELKDHVIRIHGPGSALYGPSTDELLAPLFSAPIMPMGITSVVDDVLELPVGETEIGGLALRTRQQDRHPNPTLGLRFGDALTWCTDTEADPGTVDFARGTRVLAHEAWGPPPAPGHTPPAIAADLASDASAEVLVLIHVPPVGSEEELLAAAAARHPRVVLGTDELDLLAL